MGTNFPPRAGQRHKERLERYARRMSDEIRALDRSHKSIAIDLELDEGQLSRILSAREALGVHHLETWDREIGHRLLDYILAQREETTSASMSHVSALLSQTARQHGVAIGDLLAALEDGVLTQSEARDLVPSMLRYELTVRSLVERVQEVAG